MNVKLNMILVNIALNGRSYTGKGLYTTTVNNIELLGQGEQLGP